MKQSEKLLFKALCSFKSKEFDETLLRSATPIVLGHLFFNRMQAIAFGTLNSHDLLGRVNREFRNSLRDSYTQNLEKNSSFYRSVCSFGSNWNNKIAAGGTVTDTVLNSRYQDLDVTALLTNPQTGYMTYTYGWILRPRVKDSGFSVITTGDSCYAPQIFEINYK